MRARIREWLIAAAWLGALISLYMWNGGTSVWFLMMLTAIFMLGGLALQWFGAHHIEIKRTANPLQLTAGKEVEVEVYIEFRSVLPLPWMSITDYFTEGSYNKLWFPGWRRSYTYKYYLQNLPRGITTYQVCHVEWGGLFHCFKNSYLLPCEEDIIVLPIPATISLEHGWTSQDVREGEQVEQQQRPTGIWGLEVRDYYAGDPLSRVHWKSSARRGRLQTRLLEELEDHELCIILDHNPQSYTIIDSEVGSLKNATRELFEGAVSAAAGLLQNALDEGVHVELMSGEGDLKTPIGSPSPLTTLAIIEPNGTKRISEVMEDMDQLLPGTRVAVITGGLHGELTKAVASLQRKGLMVDIYSVFSSSSLSNKSNKNGEDVELRTRQDAIANSLQSIGARLFRLNIDSSSAKRAIDSVSGKEVKSYDGSYTERRNRYV
ncbi:DUF58 domain-containing protein [Paenibacillus glacialis]|uniref:DUF58 domain-containing protein n=1 Tax=Paenibacillus glacialis TaxID=494026 RepID=A0A168IN50_9BACL|nr:DUF58 domain-containing protein [Paenibacillus glacialis]OAB39492.1 hypothetical protein PGLA_18990 [Paenibacillus glacialis]